MSSTVEKILYLSIACGLTVNLNPFAEKQLKAGHRCLEEPLLLLSLWAPVWQTCSGILLFLSFVKFIGKSQKSQITDISIWYLSLIAPCLLSPIDLTSLWSWSPLSSATGNNSSWIPHEQHFATACHSLKLLLKILAAPDSDGIPWREMLQVLFWNFHFHFQRNPAGTELGYAVSILFSSMKLMKD